MRRFRPATRTMKNSSRLLAKIARKRVRSSSGSFGSWASSSTRSLNASQRQLPVEEPVRAAPDAVGGWRRRSAEVAGAGVATPRAAAWS